MRTFPRAEGRRKRFNRGFPKSGRSLDFARRAGILRFNGVAGERRRQAVIECGLNGQKQRGQIDRTVRSGILPLAGLGVAVASRRERDGPRKARIGLDLEFVQPDRHTSAPCEGALLLLGTARLRFLNTFFFGCHGQPPLGDEQDPLSGPCRMTREERCHRSERLTSESEGKQIDRNKCLNAT